MSKVIGKITCPNGKYFKEGEEKTRWLNCGILLHNGDQDEHGQPTPEGYRIKLDCLPAGIAPGEAWFSVYPQDQPRGSAPKPAQNRSESVPAQEKQDEIPF
jgi:hypothetical protein